MILHNLIYVYNIYIRQMLSNQTKKLWKKISCEKSKHTTTNGLSFQTVTQQIEQKLKYGESAQNCITQGITEGSVDDSHLEPYFKNFQGQGMDYLQTNAHRNQSARTEISQFEFSFAVNNSKVIENSDYVLSTLSSQKQEQYPSMIKNKHKELLKNIEFQTKNIKNQLQNLKNLTQNTTTQITKQFQTFKSLYLTKYCQQITRNIKSQQYLNKLQQKIKQLQLKQQEITCNFKNIQKRFDEKCLQYNKCQEQNIRMKGIIDGLVGKIQGDNLKGNCGNIQDDNKIMHRKYSKGKIVCQNIEEDHYITRNYQQFSLKNCMSSSQKIIKKQSIQENNSATFTTGSEKIVQNRTELTNSNRLSEPVQDKYHNRKNKYCNRFKNERMISPKIMSPKIVEGRNIVKQFGGNSQRLKTNKNVDNYHQLTKTEDKKKLSQVQKKITDFKSSIQIQLLHIQNP